MNKIIQTIKKVSRDRVSPSQKFTLSSRYKLLSTTEALAAKLPSITEVEAIRQGESFLLQDHHTWHLVPAPVYYFLQYFDKESRDLTEVLQLMAKAAHCAPSDIATVTQTFFDTMCQRKVLVLAEEERPTASSDVKALFEKGQLVIRYHIMSRVVKKSKIEIYRAYDKLANKVVILKATALPLEEKNRARQQRAFAQEFELHKEIGPHPHIVDLLGYFEMDEFGFAVLENAGGPSLRKYLRDNLVCLSDRWRLATQAIQAMAHLHRQQILHGDLHMSNFLLDANYQIKLIDFNLSNRAQRQEKELRHEGGVFQYIAPEKINTAAFQMVNSPADFRSEVYQLGIIIYYIFYEQLPFEAFTWKVLADKIKNDEIEFPKVNNRELTIPEVVIKFLKIALDKNPVIRFASAEVMESIWLGLEI